MSSSTVEHSKLNVLCNNWLQKGVCKIGIFVLFDIFVLFGQPTKNLNKSTTPTIVV